MNDIYVGALFSDSYLEHHGILGMKWGVRRFQNKDGSLTPAGKKRKISNENKREETRKAVREYSKKYNKASKASDDADELWRDAKGAYKNTGKTGITRVINNATKGKFADSKTKKAISEYSKKYNKASKASDDADELWRDAKGAYKSTGKNALSRVANNIKYDPSREEKGNTKTKDKNAKSNGKKLAIAAAAAVGVGLAAYGAYKLHDNRTPKLVNTGESKTKELFGATFKPSTFEPSTFESTRIDIPRVSVPRTDVPRTNIPRTEVERTEIPRVSFKDMTIDDLKKMDLW